jgi:hypothetical protein
LKMQIDSNKEEFQAHVKEYYRILETDHDAIVYLKHRETKI